MKGNLVTPSPTFSTDYGTAHGWQPWNDHRHFSAVPGLYNNQLDDIATSFKYAVKFITKRQTN